MNVQTKTVYPRHSDWSAPRNIVSERQTSSNTLKEISINLNNTSSGNVDRPNSRESTTKKRSSWQWKLPQCCFSTPCCLGFIVGLLTAGLTLAVIITLWLTSGSKTSTTIATSTNMATIINNTTAAISATVTSSTTITTSSTMTSSTTVTTSSTTTTDTISNVCTGGAVYTTQLLYLTLTSTLPWQKYSINYTAPNITSATIMFSLRNDPDYWYLDDISITDNSGNQLVSNGDFEQGTLASWTYCNPNNAAYSGFVDTSTPHTGFYSYTDGSVNASDYLSQTFTVTPYNNYSVKFWLSADSANSSFALVSITS